MPSHPSNRCLKLPVSRSRSGERTSSTVLPKFETRSKPTSPPRRLRRRRDPGEDLLIISTDGKGIVMRHEDLRESTRRAAEKSARKLETRLTPGEKSNRKRMAQVATVYSIAPFPRAAPPTSCTRCATPARSTQSVRARPTSASGPAWRRQQER